MKNLNQSMTLTCILVVTCIEVKISNRIVDVTNVDIGMDTDGFHEFFLNNLHGVA